MKTFSKPEGKKGGRLKGEAGKQGEIIKPHTS